MRVTEDFMRMRTLIIASFILMLSLQGCATCKGAGEGFKEDWKSVGNIDDWMRENMW